VSALPDVLSAHNVIPCKVRIVDTPGFADSRDLQQAKLHRKSIAAQLKEHIDSVTAILVVANGTVPRATVGTTRALSMLSDIFPHTPAGNVAFLLTNVSDLLYRNFSPPATDMLKHAPQFLLNNPLALQRTYRRLKDTQKGKAGLREVIEVEEANAMGMLVGLFDWLDGLERRPTVEVVSRQEGFQAVVAKATTSYLIQQVKERVQRGVRRVTRVFSVWRSTW
jgi:hypothetical protein